jgi:hypothetical protein
MIFDYSLLAYKVETANWTGGWESTFSNENSNLPQTCRMLSPLEHWESHPPLINVDDFD